MAANRRQRSFTISKKAVQQYPYTQMQELDQKCFSGQGSQKYAEERRGDEVAGEEIDWKICRGSPRAAVLAQFQHESAKATSVVPNPRGRPAIPFPGATKTSKQRDMSSFEVEEAIEAHTKNWEDYQKCTQKRTSLPSASSVNQCISKTYSLRARSQNPPKPVPDLAFHTRGSSTRHSSFDGSFSNDNSYHPSPRSSFSLLDEVLRSLIKETEDELFDLVSGKISMSRRTSVSGSPSPTRMPSISPYNLQNCESRKLIKPRTEHEEMLQYIPKPLQRLGEKINKSPKDSDCGGRQGILTAELIIKPLSAGLKKDKKRYGKIEGRNIDEDIRNTQAGKYA
ncbi:hypothetical protein PPACK8108_LOCUS25461 [Phakopsora pachyrhizi]|uniref:Uncharacterized protein n=1 Tax=Phakopsora pachyrhizi TaxID=170000 RepID=A0AAV0BUQ6_PHAPC|nr:hypothetical protein PPACK8108_LOCUS25461 [Phakopsora pachyrhizi]